MSGRFPEDPQTLTYAPLWRRLAAIIYDFLLVFAAAMVTGLLYRGATTLVMGAEKANKYWEWGGAIDHDPLYRSLQFLVLFFFFSYFWRRQGQTLGMQAWRIRIQNANGTGISWMQCILRFMTALLSWACFGLGFWWMLWDKQHLTWHDRYSDSRVVLLPAKDKSKD